MRETDGKTWEILQEIKGAISFHGSLKIVWKQQDSQNDFSFDGGEKRSLAELKELGAVAITIEPAPLLPEYLVGYVQAYSYETPKDRGKILYLTIVQPKFEEVYRQFEKKQRESLEQPNEVVFDGKAQEYTKYLKDPNFLQKIAPPDPKGHEASIEKKTFIKDVRLDKQNYQLEINNGEKIISFKSRKKGKGLEKETKLFNILCHFWDFRWEELKNHKVLKKGDWVSLGNLTIASKSDSEQAAYKSIQRLNTRFTREGAAVEIQCENERYRLVIYKT